MAKVCNTAKLLERYTPLTNYNSEKEYPQVYQFLVNVYDRRIKIEVLD